MKRKQDHKGFTLVELLVVMVVISILAAGALFVLFKAESYGKEATTRGQVTALHRIVIDLWENYATLPVDVTPWDSANGETSAQYEARKKAALDAVMAMDFPNRWDEILTVAGTRTGPSRAYLARANAMGINSGSVSGFTKFQAAECLYLIVSMSTNGLEHFYDKDHFDEAGRIGDTDGDGAPEFLDGWGRPIFFLRAPTGFPSTLVSDQATNPRFLIYSPGTDKSYGLNVNPTGVDLDATDPTAIMEIGQPYVTGGRHHDNIHNHQIFD